MGLHVPSDSLYIFRVYIKQASRFGSGEPRMHEISSFALQFICYERELVFDSVLKGPMAAVHHVSDRHFVTPMSVEIRHSSIRLSQVQFAVK